MSSRQVAQRFAFQKLPNCAKSRILVADLRQPPAKNEQALHLLVFILLLRTKELCLARRTHMRDELLSFCSRMVRHGILDALTALPGEVLLKVYLNLVVCSAEGAVQRHNHISFFSHSYHFLSL